MKKLKSLIINYFIQRAKRNKFVQSLFESPFNINSFKKSGEFCDKHGNRFDLFSELRNKIKPGWEKMYQRFSQLANDKDIIEKNVSNGRIAVHKLIPLINTFSSGIESKSILEIGCHSGAVTYALAEKGAKEVVGSEFSGYKIDAVGETKEVDEVNDELKEYRKRVSKLFKDTDKVSFVDDDICNTNLPENNFDIVCSWDVLEHLSEPDNAFKNIASALKQGGIAIQEYNPFFSLNGGHSLCTLDFLWGHVRLDQEDFLRYLSEIRPTEIEKAGSFYKDGLNRMTINDLIQHSKDAGLETIALFKFTKEQHIRMLNKDILGQCKKNYSNLNADDLVTPRIIIVHKKI